MYSQHEEEKFILENCPQSGRLLEIGAWNPTKFSNSRALIERGWLAVLVEPSPIPFVGLFEAYKDNEKVTLVNALVGLEFRMREFHITDDAISTTEKANLDKWSGYTKFTKIISPEVPVKYIATGKFDFVSIDTEGTSVDILKEIDLAGLSTDLVCVEYDDRIKEAEAILSAKGFKIIHDNGCNVIGKRIQS